MGQESDQIDNCQEHSPMVYRKSGRSRIRTEQERLELAYRRLDELLRRSARPIGAHSNRDKSETQ